MSDKVAYVVSRFPQISETFILYEMVELERLGTRIELFSLRRTRETVRHAEADAFMERAHFPRLRSTAALTAQLYWLLRNPQGYVAAWSGAIGGNLRSPKFLARAMFAVPAAALFAREMRRLGVDRVHAHYATHPALTAWAIRKMAGIPYSFTVHAHDLYVDRSMLERKIGDAERIVTISNYNRELMGVLYGARALEKTAVVRLGVDVDRFRLGPARPRSQPSVLICVASLQPYKGHRILLEALARLRRDGHDFRCLLVGEGEERPALEARLERLGLTGCVSLLGAQNSHRVVELLREASAFVLPSVITPSGKMEGIPVALMEAMAMGLPVVATDISGIGELVEQGVSGLLVPQGDAAALAGALRAVLADEDEGRRMGMAGRERILRDYDLRRNARALHTALRLSG